MDDCNQCSDAGDSVQNNIGDADGQQRNVSVLDVETQGEDNDCHKAGGHAGHGSSAKDFEGKDKEREQGNALKSESSMSTDACSIEPGNYIALHGDGNCMEGSENIVTPSLDSCMLVDGPEECHIKERNVNSQGTIEESDCCCGVMESIDYAQGYSAGRLADQLSSFEESHPYTGGLYLDELDDDVLLHIASFLEARVVKYSLSKVCLRFQEMFDNEAYWKSRILKRWPKKYPAVQPLSDFNWLDACVEREDSHRVWSDPSSNTRHFMYSCNLFAEVDSVHLMKKGQLLLSGDRNRNMNMIDLSRYDHGLVGPEKEANFKDMLVHSDSTLHKGWIWCMASVDNHLITGSWDMYIRLFDINSQMVPFSSYKCKSAVLSLMAEENEIVASCFDKKVYFIDRRTDAIRSKNFHRQPVLSVTGNDQFIISGSEDKTISVFDRRAEKVMTRITLENYPLCMSFRDNHLWFGDKRGQLHLYDANQGLFHYVGMYDVGHTDKVTGVIGTRGAIFTCSGDTTVKVHTPSQDPDLIASFDVHSKQIAWLDYSHGVLASAGGEDSIGVWLPKHWDVDTYLL